MAHRIMIWYKGLHTVAMNNGCSIMVTGLIWEWLTGLYKGKPNMLPPHHLTNQSPPHSTQSIITLLHTTPSYHNIATYHFFLILHCHTTLLIYHYIALYHFFKILQCFTTHLFYQYIASYHSFFIITLPHNTSFNYYIA